MMILKSLPLRWLLPAFAYGLTALMVIGCDRGAPRSKFIRKTEWIDSGVWMKVDTHLHTTFSDGSHSVSVVAAKAREFGCDAIAITDHGDQNLKAASLEYAEAIEVARREHPELLILAGLEWNVPPWKGDTHATVLMPGGPDEFLHLADFKSQFDDFERKDPAEEHLGEQAIRWLESVETADDSRPIVILNHPSRKTGSTNEAGQQFQTMLDDSVVTIGFEGAPGHQKGKQLGAYKGPVMLMDRWDPVAAEVGGIWDQQLGSGSDVWAALATSDFHQEGDDYWPGEFSETWVYAPERSSAGVLSALRAGSFFGSHGGIAREVEISVAADGLERPAHAGEVIQVAVGGSVNVRLTGQVPELDWSGQPNHLDAVELIVVTTEGVGSTEIANTRSPSDGLDVVQKLDVPAGGLVVRARGRRKVTDGPDLMFYTNPIRIETTQSALDLSGVGPPSIMRLLNADFLRRVAGGGILLLLISVIASFRPSLSTSFGSVPVSKISVSRPTRVHYLAFAMAFTVVAIYGSLVPLVYEPKSFADAITRFRTVPFLDLGMDRRADWVANILLFVPISFCWMGAMVVDVRGSWRNGFWGLFTILTCVGFSVALEFSQIWFPQRTVSQNDIIAESIGGIVGVMIWLAAGQLITNWLRQYTGAVRRANLIDWILQAYVVGLLIYSVMPLDLTIHPAELYRKYRDGRIVVIPFWTYDFGPESIWDRLSDVLICLPVGAFATRVWATSSRLRSMRDSVLLGAMVVCLTEICQVFVYSRYAETTDVITGTVGVWLGVWFTKRLCKLPNMAPQPVAQVLRDRMVWGGLALVYTAILCAFFWWPFNIEQDNELIAERMEGYFRVPFSAMYWGSEFNALTQMLRKTLLFSVLGFLLVKMINPAAGSVPMRRLLVAVAVLYSFGLGVAIEIVQCAMPLHIADITDSMLYGFGACLGMFVTFRILSAEPEFHRHAVHDLRTGETRPDRVRPGIVPLALGGVIALIVFGVLTNALRTSGRNTDSRSLAHDRTNNPEPRTVADHWGSVFLPPPGDPHLVPQGSEIRVPDFAGRYAIWGATGRDDRGHIWFGVSAEGVEIPSAHLFEYLPETGQTIDQGSVVTELKRCGVYRRGEGQMKIHSKIIQADDGYLYFASMDEQGEKDDGSRLPTWGSHFWRLRPQEAKWEHLAAVPEGLIAVTGTGRWIYALGLFDHVLYQYDTQHASLRSVRIGSVGGHVSRNLLSDLRGHVYVPRLKQFEVPQEGEESKSSQQISVTLVELDIDLQEVSSTPLEHYADNNVWNAHGIVSFVGLADESLIFATSVGFLYRIVPRTNGPAAVEPLGWFHPEGAAYSPTLFTYTGERYVAGVALRAGCPWEWVVYDLESGISTASPAEFAQEQPDVRNDLLLYGSATRDRFGDFYIAGRYVQAGAQRPILLRLKPQAK